MRIISLIMYLANRNADQASHISFPQGLERPGKRYCYKRNFPRLFFRLQLAGREVSKRGRGGKGYFYIPSRLSLFGLSKRCYQHLVLSCAPEPTFR